MQRTMSLTGTNPSCYCCSQGTSVSMDIDAALDELGMLSTVTDSRKQYLQERMRTRSESALLSKRPAFPPTRSLPTSACSSSYQIIHIDPNYVTGFSESSNIEDNSSSSSKLPQPKPDEVFLDHGKEYRTPPENLDSSVDRRRKMVLKSRSRREDISARNRRILARKRAKEPYEVPWRLTQSFQECDLRSRLDDIPESKSNSSSPVKSYSIDSLPRSRSLDNLDFSSFFISDTGEKQEIDTVATGLKNLNVSDL